MQNEQKLKEMVRQKYREIALQDKTVNQASCCGSGQCSTEVYNIMSDDYTKLDGYNADVVVSNCVLNLVPNKDAVFKEIFRVLKPDGHFCISDVVLTGKLPEKLKQAAEMYAGCVAGAIQKEEYLQLIEDNGFMSVRIQKEKQIVIPDDILRNYLSEEEIDSYKQSGTGIFSITVFAEKSCCGPYALTCYKTC